MTSEWIETTIGEQLTLQRGFDITKAQQKPGDVPVISSGGVSSYHDVAIVKGPGVVLGRKGTVGTVFFVENDYWPHDTTLWVKDFKNNDRRFVYYFFVSFAKQLASLDVGSANPTLNRNHVHPIPVRWPSLGEQHEIAAVLATLDDKIELNRQMNATLEAMAQALFKSWFVDFEPVKAKAEDRAPEGMDADATALFPDRFEDSELGEIPAGWGTGSLLTQANLLSGGTPKTEKPEYWNGNVLWASAKDVSQARQTFLVVTERTITAKGLEESATQIIPALGTVIVARGATTGRMVLLGKEMAMNQTCYALVSSIGTPLALHCQIRQAVDALVHAAHGSVFDTITTSTFSKSKIVLPPVKTLQVFEQIASPIFKRIFTATEECLSLAALRDALLPKLISGQLRVPDIEQAEKGV